MCKLINHFNFVLIECRLNICVKLCFGRFLCNFCWKRRCTPSGCKCLRIKGAVSIFIITRKKLNLLWLWKQFAKFHKLLNLSTINWFTPRALTNDLPKHGINASKLRLCNTLMWLNYLCKGLNNFYQTDIFEIYIGKTQLTHPITSYSLNIVAFKVN